MAVVVISPDTISIDKITGPSVCLYTFVKTYVLIKQFNSLFSMSNAYGVTG